MAYASDWGAKFYARLITGTLEQSHITYLCSRFSQLVRGKNVRGVAYHDRPDAQREVAAMMDACETLKPKCTPAHTESGLSFLWNIAFTPNDSARRTKKSAQLRPNDWLLIQECKRKGDYEIRLVNFIELGGKRWCPEYELSRVDTWKGRWSLRYAMTPWQSGGYFEVTCHV